jgi:CSLREA domain-containing protein
MNISASSSGDSFSPRATWPALSWAAGFFLLFLWIQAQRCAADCPSAPPFGIFFTVNSVLDGADAAPGNGICETASGNHICTLRAAIQEANAHPGNDTIGFDLPSGSVIVLATVLEELSTCMSILGPGADKLTVQRSPAGGTPRFRIFKVTTPGVVNFSGITIDNGVASLQGFPGEEYGGGILYAGTGIVNISECVLSRNTAHSSSGGGIANESNGAINVSNCTFNGNVAENNKGGAVHMEGGTVTVTNSTFIGNSAFAFSGGPSYGGAIYSKGTLSATNCTFSGNSALGGSFSNVAMADDGLGGAIYGGGGTLNITNCTVSGNSATAGGSGAEGHGGGVAGTATIKSSIIANNTSSTGDPDVFGSLTSQGFNLIGQAGANMGFTAPTDHKGTAGSPLDPKLDPAGCQNNGGLTSTIRLLCGSPAIDKGTSSGLTGNLATDQRGTGFARAFDDTSIANAASDGADIGAFELEQTCTSSSPTPTATPTLTASPTATASATPTPNPTGLANLSTRLRVDTGDNALIGGFIITGTQPKKIIALATGPSLSQFFSATLVDPVLELYSGSALLESNDNWMDSVNKQAIIDSQVAPANNLESAIIRDLPANSSQYTAIVRGAANGVGVGTVQFYDLDRSVDSKLANISTRGLVQTGNDILIAGTIVLGQTPQKVIIRAIGPSLPLPGTLQDPTLELRDGNGGLVDSNDNWKDSPNKQAIIDSTIPPTGDAESAIVASLPSGGAQYTAIVRGVNDGTGIAVVEIYALN